MAVEDELEGSASLNDSSNTDEEGFESGYITVDVLRIILLVCGFVANVTICCVLLHKKRLLKSFANFHLFNLALANLVFVIHITLFFLPQNHIESGNEVLGKLQLFVTFTTFAVTFALLAGISTNLYLNIVHPFKARNISWKHSGVFVILSWVYAGVCSGPLLVSVRCDYIDPDDEFKECEQTMSAETIVSRTLYVIFAFVAPLAVIIASYGLVLRAMNARLKGNITGRSQAIARSKKKIVKMIIVVALSYVLTWSPELLWFVFDAYGITPNEQTIDEIYADDSADVQDAIHRWQVQMFCQTLIELITYLSFVFNPVIFGYYSQNFREGFKELFCKKKNYRLPLLKRLDHNKIDPIPSGTGNVFILQKRR